MKVRNVISNCILSRYGLLSQLRNDTQMEEKIIKHLKKLKSKVTVISITHRHKSLESCDRIFRIEEGKLTEVKTAD